MTIIKESLQEQYRFVEKLLNDFRNNRIGYEGFIEKMEDFWKGKMLEAIRETQRTTRSHYYEKVRREAIAQRNKQIIDWIEKNEVDEMILTGELIQFINQ